MNTRKRLILPPVIHVRRWRRDNCHFTPPGISPHTKNSVEA
jgi:hypothetical protein